MGFSERLEKAPGGSDLWSVLFRKLDEVPLREIRRYAEQRTRREFFHAVRSVGLATEEAAIRHGSLWRRCPCPSLTFPVSTDYASGAAEPVSADEFRLLWQTGKSILDEYGVAVYPQGDVFPQSTSGDTMQELLVYYIDPIRSAHADELEKAEVLSRQVLDLARTHDEPARRQRLGEVLDELKDPGLRQKVHELPSAEACLLLAGPIREKTILHAVEKRLAACVQSFETAIRTAQAMASLRSSAP